MSVQIRRSASGQAMPRETVQLPAEAFGPSDTTTVYWLGNAGFLLNSRGTTIMCDPLLVGFDMPVLVEPPILPEDVPALVQAGVKGLMIGAVVTGRDKDSICRAIRAFRAAIQEVK